MWRKVAYLGSRQTRWLLIGFTLVSCTLVVPGQSRGQGVLALNSPNEEYEGSFGWITWLPTEGGGGPLRLLVGAIAEDVSVYWDAGRCYVFPATDGSLVQTLESPHPSIQGLFGIVFPLYDVDGDGFDDIGVGALLEDVAGQTWAGRAYVYSGTDYSVIHELISPNPEMAGLFGGETVGVPDVDGDGRGDVVVSAYYEDVESDVDAGRAYVFSGSSGALIHTLTSPNRTASPPDTQFGWSVGGSADVDGDNRGDLLVSCYPFTASVCRVYIFSGSSGAVIRTFTGGTGFGAGASWVSDMDDDGYNDVAIGQYDRDGTGEGVVYVYSSASGDLMHTLVSPNQARVGRFGGMVSGVPDVTGDGQGDIVVGAGYEDAQGFHSAGRVYVFSGSTGDLFHVFESPNAEAGGQFGFHARGIPDVDEDGLGDVAVCAIDEEGLASTYNAGRAYVFKSHDFPTSVPTYTPTFTPTVTATPTRCLGVHGWKVYR
jgi:hypothetical protein